MNANRTRCSGITGLTKRALAAVIAMTFVLSGGLFRPLPVRAQATTWTWTGGAGDGLWETESNWNPVGVPADGDTVNIPVSAKVTCTNASVSVKLQCAGELTVSGGTLNLTATSWLTGGKIDGAGDIAVTGAGSQLIWQGGNIQGTGSFTLETGSKLVIQNATTKALARPLSSAGEIFLNEGTLNLSGGGQVETGGKIALSLGTVLQFAGDNYTVNSPLSESGKSFISVNSGSVAFNGNYTITNTAIGAGATGTWNVITNLPFLSVSGDAVFNNNVTVAGLVLESSGTIDGDGAMALISGSNKLLNGGVIAGTGELAVSGLENLSVSGACSVYRHLTNSGFMMIEKGGSLDLSGGAGGTGSLRIRGVLRLGAGAYSFGGPGQVINDGQLIISDTCSTVQLNTYLNQQSVSGTLAFDIGQDGYFCKLEIPSNQAMVNGSQLKINLVDDFVPTIGSTFEAMTYTSCSGRFASVTSNAEGLVFEPTYGPNALTVTAVEKTETDPPVWAPSYPQATDVTTSSFKLKTQIDEVGTAFYVILDDGAPAPDATQVKFGQNSTGKPVGRNGFTNLSPNAPGIANISGLTPDTAYDAYVVAQDQAGNLQTTPVILHIATMSDTPSAEAEITAYSLPGQTGDAVFGDGTIDIVVPYNTDVTGLKATFSLSTGASAKVGGIAQDSGNVANDFTSPVVYTVTAEDGSTTKDWTVTVTKAAETVPPAWVVDYPQAADVTTSGFTLKAKIDEAGTAYYVILGDGAIAPSSSQVKAGQDNADQPVQEGRKGSIALTADTEASTGITGLNAETAYDIYVVAEDATPNLQAEPVRIDVKTLKVPSAEAEITAYSLAGQIGQADINSEQRTIAITVPYGTNVTALVATFTLSEGATAEVDTVDQDSGITENDFTSPVVYTVTAEDGSTTKDWTVTVTKAAETVPPAWVVDYPQAADVTTSGFTLKAKIDEAGTAYYVILEDGAPDPSSAQVRAGHDKANQPVLDGRKGSFDLTANTEASIDITGLNADKSYDIYVVAEDELDNLQDAPVKRDVKTLKVLSAEAEITAYSLAGQIGQADINSEQRTIAITVPYGTNVTALVATFTLSEGATAEVDTVDQDSGITENDFTSPVVYTVTAEDGSTTKTWTVTVTVEPGFAGGAGTEANPYLVATANHLNNVRYHLAAHFKQTADIDLSAPYNQSEGWVPIGIWDTPFTGTYDGNNKTITGLRINRESSAHAGLFGAAKGATFRDLTLANVEILGQYGVGGLVGVVAPQSSIPTQVDNVHVTDGSVRGTSRVGGLVGTLSGSNILRSSAGCSVTGVEQCLGGLVGQVDSPATISECHATGNVSVSGTGLGQSVGGLAGNVPGSCTVFMSYASGKVTGKDEAGGLVGCSAGQISCCFASGAVEGAGAVGGLVGNNYGGQISFCYAGGTVTATGYAIGGLVGKNVLGGTVGNCYAMGPVQGVSQVGGLVGWNPTGSITCTYATGSVSVTGYGHGGLIGEGGGGCTKSYWDTDTSGCTKSQGGPGAVGKTTTEMKQQDTYADWSFTEVWDMHISQNSGYPFLVGVTPVGPAIPSTEAEIAAFSFSPSDGVVINYMATTGTVEVLVDSGTDVTTLVATFTLSSGASAKVGTTPQVSGATANNFTNPVTYRVTAEDGTTTRNWTVKVTKRESKSDTEEPLWYYRSPWPTAKSLREVKYLNGKFMAVGEKGALVVSANGSDWTTSDLGIADTLEGVAYGNGKYIAIGNQRTGLDGTIYGSADGVSWTHLATIPNHRLGDIVCVGGKFVAVGQSGGILTSADGTTWKVTAAPEIKDRLNAVAYADGTYVAVGDGGVVVTSTDGENWTEQVSLGSDTLRDVAYGNGRFVTVGGYDTACIYSSTDSGETWSKYAFGMTCYGLLRSVEYDGSQFVAVGYRPNAVAPNLFTSADGQTWTRRSNIPSDVSFGSVAGGGDVWVAACFRYGIVTSTDGITWTKLGQGTREYLSDVAYDGTTFVSVGYKGTIQTSSDGITWTFRDSGTSDRLRTVKHLNHKLVAVGDKGTILTSEDGTNWTRETSGTSVELYDVTYGDGKYIAVGGTGSNDVILVSTDGIQWTPVDHDYMIPFVAVTYGNGKFVALGQNGQVYVSSDGTEWPRTYLPGSGNYPQDIIYVNGRFVAVGGYGEVYVSDNDGATWTVQEKVGGVNEYIYSVAYGGGNLVGVTAYGNILISTDKGDSWTAEPSGFDERLHLYGVTAGDEGFVAVGEWGLVLQSKDFGAPGDPDANAVAKDKAALTWDVIAEENTRQDSITGDLVNPLPTSGANGTTISWSVSHGGFINTTTGAVTRPTFTQGDQTVVLTATISKGTASDTVTFMLKVVALDPTPDESITVDLTWLTWNLIRGSNSTEGQVKTGLNLVDSGPHDTTIRWSAEPAGVINTTTGLVTRPAAGQGNVQVRLTAVVSKEGGQNGTEEFELTIIALSDSGSGGIAPTYYTISATAGPGGTISPESAAVAAHGSQTFTITPDSGYEISDVLVDGKSIGAKTTYTFEKVTGKHTISATFKRIFPFKDVKETDWFYNSVKYAFENGLMTGTSTDIFNPLVDTSRAMIVTILHRLEQTPDTPANIFTDVDAGTWYTDAVAWAAANGIVKGYGGGLFGPTDSVTREQLACILYNYARYAGYDVSQSAELTGFIDGGSTSDWAVEAMQWAVGSGLIRGKGNNLLDPTGPATRAEVAAILERLIEGNAK
jgi:hypothetical protein